MLDILGLDLMSVTRIGSVRKWLMLSDECLKHKVEREGNIGKAT